MNRLEFIKDKMFGKVLDIGCGGCGKELHNAINNEEVYGMDRVVVSNDSRICKADAQELPYKNGSFDTVIAGELIEHLSQPSKFLEEIYRVLRSDGILIITTPNKNSWMNILFKASFTVKKQKSLFVNFLHSPQQDISCEFRHRTIFTKETLIDLIKKHGFEVEKFLRLPHLEMYWLDKNNPYNKKYMLWKRGKNVFLLLRRIIHHFVPEAIQESLILTARKIE